MYIFVVFHHFQNVIQVTFPLEPKRALHVCERSEWDASLPSCSSFLAALGCWLEHATCRGEPNCSMYWSTSAPCWTRGAMHSGWPGEISSESSQREMMCWKESAPLNSACEKKNYAVVFLCRPQQHVVFILFYTVSKSVFWCFGSMCILLWLAELLQHLLSCAYIAEECDPPPPPNLWLQPGGSESWSGRSPRESLRAAGVTTRRSRDPGRRPLSEEIFHPPSICLPERGESVLLDNSPKIPSKNHQIKIRNKSSDTYLLK